MSAAAHHESVSHAQVLPNLGSKIVLSVASAQPCRNPHDPSSLGPPGTVRYHRPVPLPRFHTRSPLLMLVSSALVVLAVVGEAVWFGPMLGLPLLALGLIGWTVCWRAERSHGIRQAARLAQATSSSPGTPLEQATTAAVQSIRSLTQSLRNERATPWFERAEVARLIEAFGEATLFIGEDGIVLLANERCTRLLGINQPLKGRHIEDLITKAELLEEIASARRGVGGRSTIRLPRAEGARICETTTTPISTGAAYSPVMVTIRDVTDLANAIQVKTDFVANASHELRTPIASIRAAADTLEAAGGDETMRQRLTEMIRNHSIRLDELVRDLLDLSKLESQGAPVAIKPLRMSELAAELAEVLEESCQRYGVELEFDLDPRLERVRSDRRLILLILKNLAENATKFARTGTPVRVQGRVISAGSRSSEGHAADAMQLRITDKGQGIPIAQQQRIFERFFQVDQARTGSERRGTGLGLAIVKHAAKLLDGTVRVESVWGQGPTMIVDLPGCVDPEPKHSVSDH